ncbi:MAG: TIGR04206 family protein [Halapricum sp.]
MAGPRRRLILVALVGLLPWTLVATGGLTTLFFPFGFLGVDAPLRVVTIYEYLFVFSRGLPQYIYAWPLGVVLYSLALVSAVLGLIEREDRRLTAGLLVLVALTQLQFAVGFGRRSGYTAVPFASITTLTLVWWVYWPDLKGALFDVRS